jgi:glucans biosynthesis protein C
MGARLAYLDTLKVLLVVGVIAMHTAITYGLDGSWYLESYDEMSGGVVDGITALLGVGWLFGLGLFFLIAGRLTAPSLERKGPRLFVKDRLIRLGIPLAAYTLLVSPFLEYVAYRENEHGTEPLWPFVREQVWHFAPGPTWFLEALLVFSLAYALLRALRRDAPPPARRPLRGFEVAGIAVLIAFAAFAAHLVFPVGSEQFHLQLAMFPQYVILFSLGVAAGRRGWLETLTPQLRRRCGLAGVAAALAFPALLLAGGFFDGGAAEDRFAGGWHWQAAAGALLEGILATCVSLWAVGHFRANQRRYFRPLIRRMAPPAYGAFIIHPPVLVGLAFAVQPLPVPAELKFLTVLVAGVAASFSVTAVALSAFPSRHTRPPRRPASSAQNAPPHETRTRGRGARREASRPVRSL